MPSHSKQVAWAGANWHCVSHANSFSDTRHSPHRTQHWSSLPFRTSKTQAPLRSSHISVKNDRNRSNFVFFSICGLPSFEWCNFELNRCNGSGDIQQSKSIVNFIGMHSSDTQTLQLNSFGGQSERDTVFFSLQNVCSHQQCSRLVYRCLGMINDIWMWLRLDDATQTVDNSFPVLDDWRRLSLIVHYTCVVNSLKNKIVSLNSQCYIISNRPERLSYEKKIWFVFFFSNF